MSGRTRSAAHVGCLLGMWLASAAMAADGEYRRVEQQFQVPDAILTDPWGKSFSLAQELGAEGPVLLNFITVTGCPDDCAGATRAFAALQRRGNLRLISIARDPRRDTATRLRAWAKQIGVGPGWMVLSGSRRELMPILQAFGADEKSSVTFFHRGPKAPWVRLEGPLSAAELVSELH